MKRLFLIAAAASTLLLGGCASTIRSDVTTFHQWPSELNNKTYVFEAPTAQEDTLEFRSYQNMVRGELAKLGLMDAGDATPGLKVAMHFQTIDRPVTIVAVADPFFYPPSRRGILHAHWHGWYGPYAPSMYAPYSEEEMVYQRQLVVSIKSAADGKRLFDVSVRNQSQEMSTPVLMPALIHSAFVGFPGPNGAARHVELKSQP